MGFHEDDRIRSKNSSYTEEGITNNSNVRLKLNDIPIADIVELLVSNGYRVELEPHHTISVGRKLSNEENVNHDNRITDFIRTHLVCSNSKSK